MAHDKQVVRACAEAGDRKVRTDPISESWQPRPLCCDRGADDARVPRARHSLGARNGAAVWPAEPGALAPLRAHTAAVGALKFNPTRMILASACAQPAVALWLPC